MKGGAHGAEGQAGSEEDLDRVPYGTTEIAGGPRMPRGRVVENRTECPEEAGAEPGFETATRPRVGLARLIDRRAGDREAVAGSPRAVGLEA